MNWKLTNSMIKGSKLWSKQYLNSIAFRCSSSYSKNNSGFNPVLQNSFIDSTNSKDTDPWLNETWKTKRKLDRTQHESKLLRHRAREPDLNAFRQALQRKDRVLAWLKFKDISITVQSKQLTRADYLDLLHLLLSQDKRKPSIPTINHVINTMKTMDISVDIDVYNILVKSYAYSNQEEQISNTLRKMKELGISPNLETYSIIIYMYLKSQSIEKALAFIDRMKQENIPYNTSTYNTIIAGLINCGQLDLAQSFYKEMKENGFENNSGTFIQLIRLSIKLDDLPTAERIFEESIELGLVNKYTCSAILSFYAKLGDEVKIDGVLEYMKKNSIELDSLIYQSVIQSKLANKNIDGAFEIIEKMKMENIYPDFVTVHTILHGIVETGDLDRAIAYLEEQKGQGRKISFQMYSTLLIGLSKQLRTKELFYVFDSITTEMNVQLYNVVLEHCSTNSDFESFRKYWYKLAADKLCEPSIESLEIALKTFIRSHNITDAMDVVLEMIKQKNQPSMSDLSLLLLSSVNARRFEDASKVIFWINSVSGGKKVAVIQSVVDKHLPEFEKVIFELDHRQVAQAQNQLDSSTENYQMIINLFKDLVIYATQPSEAVLQVVMNTYYHLDDLVGVVKTWTILQKLYPNPLPNSLTILLKTANDLGQEKTALSLKNLIKTHSYTLDKQGYKYMILLSVLFTSCEDIPSLMLDMVNAGFTPDKDLWIAMQEHFDYRLKSESNSVSQHGTEAYRRTIKFLQEYYPEIMHNDADDLKEF